MRVTNKRDLLRLLNDQRGMLGVRFIARIATNPSNQSPFAAPFAANAEEPNPTTDAVVYGKGIFQSQHDDVHVEGTGRVVTRKGFLDVHPTYEETFRKAYSVQVGGTTGLWEVLGVEDSVGQVQIRVTLQSRQ